MTDGGEPKDGPGDAPPGTDELQRRARTARNPLSIAGHLEYDRVLFFSDAVFAIAITLLVVDIRVPISRSGINAGQELHDAERQILGFFISFLVIGLFWMGHHRLFRYITALDRPLIFLNLVFLGTIAFVPYPTALLFASSTDQVTATVFYAACIAGAGLAELVVWLYAIRAHGRVPASVSPALRRYETLLLLPVPVVFALSIPVAFANPVVGSFTWLLLLPIGRVLRLSRFAKEANGVVH